MSTAMSVEAAAEWRGNWKLVLASTVGASMMSIALTSLGAFIGPLEQAFAWKRAQISGGLLLFSIASIFLAPVLGGMIDRWGLRWFAVVGVVLTGLGFAAFGTATASIVHWYALWALFSAVAQIPRPMIWSAAISRTFKASRGQALGIVLCGGSLGSLTAPVLAGHLTSAVGWRLAYIVMGAAWGSFAGIFCYLFFHPGKAHSQNSLNATTASSDFSLRGTLLSSTFLKLAVSTLLANTLLGAFLVHIFPLLTDAGLSRADVTWIAGLMGLTSMCGPMAAGWLADRVPGHFVSASFVALFFVACGMLLVPTNSIVLRTIPILLIGIAGGERAHMTSYLTSRYFGLGVFGRIFGVVASMMAIGIGVGPILAGYIYDQTHSYNELLIIGMPVAATASFLILSLGHYPEAKSRTGATDIVVSAPGHAT